MLTIAANALELIIPLVALAIIVGWRLWQWRRWQRLRRMMHGRCLHCGHVLHGSRGTLCPECGKNIQPENKDNQRLMGR